MTNFKQLPKIAIIGRTNAGKSTLFNCLIEEKKALVSTIPGTTRDINYGVCTWRGKNFILQDTAGLDVKPQNIIEEKAIKKTLEIIKDSDLILFVVDAKTGLLPQDKELALLSKKNKKPIILVCNKTDSPKQRERCAEFYKLGLKDPIHTSAKSGSGTGDLLDEVVKQLRKVKKLRSGRKTKAKEKINVAIIGKPNVGKSSLLNSILGEDHVIVSDIPHTTREPQDITFEYQDHEITLVDTAGIRKKSKTKPVLEKKGILASLNVLKKVDIAILVIEANERITTQDRHLAGLINELNKGLIFVANKWDLIEDKTTDTQNEFIKYIYGQFPYLTFSPIIFVSAKTGQRVKNILDLILEIKKAREIEVDYNALDKFLKKIIKKHKPARTKGTKHPYIYELKQVGTNPPKFLLTVDDKENIHFSYTRFIENKLRDKFGFDGTPIKLRLKEYRRVKVKK